ncbi:FecR family protein [Prolixibacter bellariivorans]|uniref:FecR family protein n=1 Tax=Prolixibacter bellariivorans TaxID=314319 RepID=UPI00131F3E5C|nr:FecR family protein [Prolixibacter bellariivorans]
MVLPDKSVVWLNAGSTLEYPSEFSQQTRHVSLTGEAFFSVTKNKAKPFVVTTANLSVRVLGTKFNLKAYPDDNRTVATLQEGRIAVRTKDKQQRKLLPNQQLTYNNRTSLVQIVKIAPGDIPDWKNGNLTFTDATLGEVLQTLRRRFNISIETDKSIDLSTEHYTIKFERGENPEQILRVLEDVAGDFTYTKENKRIVLHKK